MRRACIVPRDTPGYPIWRILLRQESRRLFGPALLFIILASIIFVYSEGTFDANYQGEDYLFVSQVSRVGFPGSILLSWKDHFIPLYRLTMGGLHLLFANAVPIRVATLLFHLANTALIFHIVRGRARSVTLAAVAATTFGLSHQAASELLFSINGHWVMSLCFVLLMSVCLERLLESRSVPSLPNPPETSGGDAPSHAAAKGTDDGGGRASVPSTKDLTDITLRPTEWKMKFYYAALACFAVGLGFFTIALVGGGIVWAFAYARLLREGDFRRSLRLQAKVLLPFMAIVGVYLLMRSHFNEVSRPYVDSMTYIVMERPDVTPARALEAVADLPIDFYATLLQRTTPFYEEYYLAAIIVLGLLLVKEIVVRRKEAAVALMWLGVTAMTIAVPVVGRLFFVLKGSGNVENLLFPWYFYVPVAGVAIALGLLLRPPPRLEKKLGGFSALRRGLLSALVVAILAALSFENANEIRTFIPGLVRENQRFHGLLTEYESSMASFLESPAYLPERQYYFKDGVSAGTSEFPLSWYVLHHDIFYLFFPDRKNVHFISGFRHHGDLYFWSPDGIVKKQWDGGL